MGGLKTSLPTVFWTFLIGAASLSALPLVTAGFYSKEMILNAVWASAGGGPWLWCAGVAGALLTSIYAFRVVFMVFFGRETAQVGQRPGVLMTVPLVILAIFSMGAGFIELPKTLGNVTLLTGLMHTVLPDGPSQPLSLSGQAILEAAASFAALLGVFVAAFFYLVRPGPPT